MAWEGQFCLLAPRDKTKYLSTACPCPLGCLKADSPCGLVSGSLLEHYRKPLGGLEELPELGVLRALLLLPSLWGLSTCKHPQGERHAAARRCLISFPGALLALLTGLLRGEGFAKLATAEQMIYLSVKWDFCRVLTLQVPGGDSKVQTLFTSPSLVTGLSQGSWNLFPQGYMR